MRRALSLYIHSCYNMFWGDYCGHTRTHLNSFGICLFPISFKIFVKTALGQLC